MKKQLVHVLVISAIIMHHSMHSMNYLTSAYQQVAATGQTIKQQAQDVKARTQQLLQLISCFQNKLGCSAVQMNSIHDALRNIDLSLRPLVPVALGAKTTLQKPINFMQSKVAELRATIQEFGNRFTPEQKKAFIAGVKKVVIAAAILVAVAAVAAIGKAVIGGKEPLKSTDEQTFVAAFVKKDLTTIRKNINNVSLAALQAAQAMVEADRNYPDRSALLTELRIAVHTREAFPEVYDKTYLPPAMLPDDEFVMYVSNKNIPVVQDWLSRDVPTIEGLEKAEEIIENDAQYPSRSNLLGKIRQAIHAKEFAEDIRAQRQSIRR